MAFIPACSDDCKADEVRVVVVIAVRPGVPSGRPADTLVLVTWLPKCAEVPQPVASDIPMTAHITTVRRFVPQSALRTRAVRVELGQIRLQLFHKVGDGASEVSEIETEVK
jgi:hypothetical protein